MSKKCTIKWGILGTSFISEKMAQAILDSNTGLLTAVASRTQETAENFAEKFSVPTFYDNYQSLLNDKEIDAIYIGLPNHLHKEWMIRAAEAGKHILCEKPFTLTTLEAKEVIEAVKKANVFCMEALMYRCHPFTKKLQELVSNKIIGDIKLFTATYTADIVNKANKIAGGSIRNLGCYPVSLVRLLAQAEPVEMQTMGRLNQHNNDSQASILLKFPNDVMAVVSTADDMEMFWQFDIYGSEGCLQVITNPWFPEENNQVVVSRNNEEPIEIEVNADKSTYTYQIDAFGDSILNNHMQDECISLGDSLENVSLLEKWVNAVKASQLVSA